MAGLKRHQTLLLLRCYMKRGSFLEYFTHVPDVQSSFSKKQSKGLKIWSFGDGSERPLLNAVIVSKNKNSTRLYILTIMCSIAYIFYFCLLFLTTFKPKKKKPILKPPLFHILAVEMSPGAKNCRLLFWVMIFRETSTISQLSYTSSTRQELLT